MLNTDSHLSHYRANKQPPHGTTHRQVNTLSDHNSHHVSLLRLPGLSVADVQKKNKQTKKNKQFI